jgi:ribulose 1,5-bisphosphate carboxylase large subunit-like protein
VYGKYQTIWFQPMLYLFSGGTTQLSVAKAVSECGIDVIVAAGGAVHGHPDGSRAGARSMRQAMDAAVKGIDLTEYAKTAPELISMLQMLDPEIQKNFALMN